MAFDNLADFIHALEDDGDVVRIADEVDCELELASIVEGHSQQTASPAVFFERVKGHSVPVVANLFGTEKRLCRALEVSSFDELADRLLALIQPDIPGSWLESLQLVPKFTSLLKLSPTIVKTAICQQVVKIGQDVDLGELPFPRCWPKEENHAITSAQIVAATFHADASKATSIASQVPLQVLGRDRLAVHWTVRDQTLRLLEEYRAARRQMPVAIVLGGDPLLAYAASVPLPANTDASAFASFVRQAAVELIPCRTIDLHAPANAEIVIEGMIDPEAEWVEVPGLGLSTGFYGPPERVPTVQVTGVTQRSNPLLPVTITGLQKSEQLICSRATERLTLPLVKLAVPGLVDIHCPDFGVFRNCVFASIDKTYPGQARQVMNALWGISWFSTMKQIIVVDADVDVHDEQAVLFHSTANMHPGRDVVFSEGPTTMDDHAAPIRGMGHKMGIDGTRKRAEEGHPREWPDVLATDS